MWLISPENPLITGALCVEAAGQWGSVMENFNLCNASCAGNSVLIARYINNMTADALALASLGHQ